MRVSSLVFLALVGLSLATTGCATGGGAEPRPPLPAASDGEMARAVAAAPADASLQSLGGAVSLADLLPLLLERNPSVRAARARLEAAAERYPQAISLPDPMVEATYFTRNAMDPEDSFSRYNLMARQDVPFPMILVLRGREAEKGAEAEALGYEAAVRDAVAELKDVLAERSYLASAAAVQAAIRDVYRRYAELARADMTTGRTRLPESFRAEALLAQAGYELLLLEEVRAVEDQRLRSLLALPPGTPLGETGDVAPVAPMATKYDDLMARALAYNQELRAAGVEVEIAQLAARRARWDYAPMFTVGAGKMVNDAFEMDTGETRDGAVVSLGLTLPLWWPAKAAAVREADARQRGARAAESGQRERLAADVARTAFRVNNSARLAQLYGGELVPQAEAALLRSQEMVREGKESLASSLELAATWQQLRLAELRSVADHAQALAALERLLGTSAVPAPEGTEHP